MPNIVDIRKRYEQLFPMTTWSDEEIQAHLAKQEVTESEMEIIRIDTSLEEYMKANNCCYLEDFIAVCRNRISR